MFLYYDIMDKGKFYIYIVVRCTASGYTRYTGTVLYFIDIVLPLTQCDEEGRALKNAKVFCLLDC